MNRSKFTTPPFLAFYTTIVVGFFAHLYALTNVLHNYDDIGNLPNGYGTGAESGRWLLTILGRFFREHAVNFNLPYWNGLIFILFIAISAGFLVSALCIQNKVLSALIGALLITFPSATSTLFFRYTAIYYGVGFLLSILAVWFSEKYKFGMIGTILCIACSLGIYQAYLPMSIALFVLVLIRRALMGEESFEKIFFRGFFYCVMLVLGLLAYYAMLNYYLTFTSYELLSYQGIDQMGQIAVSDLPQLIMKSFSEACTFHIKDYCDLASIPLIKYTYFVLFAFSALSLIIIFIRLVKKPTLILMSVALFCILPLAINFIVVMTPTGWRYTLMVYPFVLFACLPIMLADIIQGRNLLPELFSSFFPKITAILATVLILCYTYQANSTYTSMYYSNRQIENYLNGIVVQVRMTEGFSPDQEWALIGNIQDPLLNDYWTYPAHIGGIAYTENMLNRYSRDSWIRFYLGYSIPYADSQKQQELSALSEVKEMPCWPAEGSIKVINDVVVIKFEELHAE